MTHSRPPSTRNSPEKTETATQNEFVLSYRTREQAARQAAELVTATLAVDR